MSELTIECCFDLSDAVLAAPGPGLRAAICGYPPVSHDVSSIASPIPFARPLALFCRAALNHPDGQLVLLDGVPAAVFEPHTGVAEFVLRATEQRVEDAIVDHLHADAAALGPPSSDADCALAFGAFIFDIVDTVAKWHARSSSEPLPLTTCHCEWQAAAAVALLESAPLGLVTVSTAVVLRVINGRAGPAGMSKLARHNSASDPWRDAIVRQAVLLARLVFTASAGSADLCMLTFGRHPAVLRVDTAAQIEDAVGRLKKRVPYVHPAEQIGDTGVATVAVA